MKTKIEKSIRSLLLIPFSLGCFGLAPMAQAVGPDTDGAIPGSNNGEGIGVLVSRTTGVWNTGTGFEALSQLTAGNQNTATGLRALTSDTNGGYNTGTGAYSLFSNTSGFFNSATGAYSLANNTDGNYNTAVGYGALYRNTADGNTAIGFGALFVNTTGASNVAVGFDALNKNTTGSRNTANGARALLHNITGDDNTANGYQALASNTTGASNTANGVQALVNNATGASNTALGVFAGDGVTTADNVIAIGTAGANVNNSCFIGNIFNATASGGTAVFVNSAGQLGTATSSRRYKKEIKAMEQASEAILSLKPVTFHYKSDPAAAGPQFGLIAEEVAEVNPDLVVRDENGGIYTVRYDAVNAMLLNEFLKEHLKVEHQDRKMQEQEAAIFQLRQDFQSKFAEQQKQIKALMSDLERVNNQLELSKPAPQIVATTP